MSTRHVILDLIREKPSHPYDVAVRFGKRLQLWQVNRGQVYKMVSQLEDEGLIEQAGKRESERSGPAWRLTPAGVGELDRWFATRSEDVEPLRGELVAKLAVAEPKRAPELLAALDWYQRAIIARIEAEVHEQQTRVETEGWQDELVDCIVDGAMLHRNAELAWLERVREVVQGWSENGCEVNNRATAQNVRSR